MCGSNKPKSPTVKPAPTAPPIVAPIDADADAKAAGDEERRKRQAASGRSSTILTGGLGDTSAPSTGKKRLLGE